VVGAGAVAPDLKAAVAPRRITILGATGSIGTSTLDVVAEHPERFSVETVTANANAAKLAAVARKVGARLAVIADPAGYAELKADLSGSGIAAAAGPDAVADAARRPADMVVAAIVGAAGLAPTFAAVKSGAHVALANKECLVSAGALFMSAARESRSAILPVDSEHNAIFQILDGRDRSTVDRIVVTASGGPFRNWSLDEMSRATPAEALRHPNWSMGQKITIDSATLMNKGLEIIEAHYLFDQPAERLGVLIHPQSIVHGLVSFTDGYLLAALSAPDMRTPIAHCLAWPEASQGAGRRLDLATLSKLEFEAPDAGRFPALKLAREALEAGGAATNILSAANEIAVMAFLAGRIGFLEIAGIVADTLSKAAGLINRSPATIDEAVALDSEARRLAELQVAAREVRRT
jgi:1-deoxy-D-xylulose-5-phosphate reductoisomerase